MIVIGITGGIASGKSTIARMMAGRGITHVDADALVHDLMRDKNVIEALTERFPKAVKDGAIDRKQLGEIVGKDKSALEALEGILHPKVRDAEIAAIKKAIQHRRKAIVLDIPLLFESGADSLCDIVIAASSPLPLRKRRAFMRAGMSEAKFTRLIDRQLDERTRADLADVVIPTSIGKAFTRRQVTLLLRELELV